MTEHTKMFSNVIVNRCNPVNIRFSKYNYRIKKYRHIQQNRVVLAQKQTHRTMEQNREPRNKSIHLWSINLLQKRQECTMEKR